MNKRMVMGIDPGTTQSAFVDFDGTTIHEYGKVDNDVILMMIAEMLNSEYEVFVAIEQIKSYGMAVGAEVFETCWWSGRFYESAMVSGCMVAMIPRKEVCKHVCDNAGAKDANVRQAMIDRFGPQGIKKAPGITYGISKDVWSALAIACTQWDRIQEEAGSAGRCGDRAKGD